MIANISEVVTSNHALQVIAEGTEIMTDNHWLQVIALAKGSLATGMHGNNFWLNDIAGTTGLSDNAALQYIYDNSII